MGGALETGRAHRTRARVKNRGKAESSKAQNREWRSAFEPRSSCGFCVIVSDVAVPEVTLNQRVERGSKRTACFSRADFFGAKQSAIRDDH